MVKFSPKKKDDVITQDNSLFVFLEKIFLPKTPYIKVWKVLKILGS